MATDKEPMMKIAGRWVPTHKVWKMLETVNTATDLVDRFNQDMPEISSSHTQETVAVVRERIRSLQMSMPQEEDEEKLPLGDAAIELLKSQSPEEAVATLEQEYGTKPNLKDLITLVGPEAYTDSLRGEVAEYVQNMITPDQIAELWNESRRPAPNGGLWSENLVRKTFDL